MKGAKKRTSVDPPPPPPSMAEDGGCAILGDKCAEAGKDLPPVLESLAEKEVKLQKIPVKSAANGDVAGAGDGDDEGEEEEDDEEEQQEGEKGGNDDKDMEIEDGGADAGMEGPMEPPKLAEGFYEIEAVRKKRTRKGKPEFLIKWRGWPETANTWEPMDNLVAVPDVIAAFEQRSAKRSSRKQKRKNRNFLSQSKKKQFKPSPPASTCNVPDVKMMIIEETSPAAAQTETGALNHGGSNGTGIIDLEAGKQSNESGMELPASGTEGTEIGNGVTAIPDKENLMDQFQDKSQLARISGQAAVANGSEITESAEAFQNGRSTGARRRKSGPVRRFKQQPSSCSVQDLEKAASNFHFGSGGNQFPQNSSGLTSIEDGGCNTKRETYKAICDIIEIIKPMNYTTSVSGNSQDVCVTFAAKRADGTDVTVDNKFLKSHNPVLLLNYYEQHLRYNVGERADISKDRLA